MNKQAEKELNKIERKKKWDKYEVVLYLPMGYKEVNMRGIAYDND